MKSFQDQRIRWRVWFPDLDCSANLVDIAVLQSASADEGALSLSRIEPAGMVIGLRDARRHGQQLLPVSPGD